MRPQFWQRAFKKAHWMMRLSGLTYRRSTLEHGVERWISSLVGGLVPTSQPQASEQDSAELHPPSGPRCSESPSSAAPPTSSLRTSQPFARLTGGTFRTAQLTLFESERLAPYSETWPKSGLMRDGAVYEHPMSEHRIGENGGLCWPTARSAEAEHSGRKTTNHDGQVGLTEAANNWNTPRTITGGAESAERKQQLGRTESGGGDLQSQVDNWNTPRAGVHGDPGPHTARGALDSLGSQVDQWPTPTSAAAQWNAQTGVNVTISGVAQQWPTASSRDHKGSANWENRQRSGKARKASDMTLPDKAEIWPTPDACLLRQEVRDEQESKAL